MIKQNNHVIMVKKEIPTTEEMYCDVCGKLIGERHMSDSSGELTSLPGSQIYYWDCSTMHHDWGNDSCDSFESADICSDKCLKEWIDKYIDDGATRELTIKHKRF